MFCGPKTVNVFFKAKPRETSTVKCPQNILFSSGTVNKYFIMIAIVKEMAK